MTSEPESTAEMNTAGGNEATAGLVDDALDLLFKGRVEELVPPEELGEFHDFIREEAIQRRRFAVSFRLDCGCLAWIGYALANVVTHDEGMEFTANPTESFIPDHEADVEHPEGPTEAPPEAFEDWPIWPFEIYQDEADDLDEGAGFDEVVDDLAADIGVDPDDSVAALKAAAAAEDPLSTDELGV
jgi:hypothetical protein